MSIKDRRVRNLSNKINLQGGLAWQSHGIDSISPQKSKHVKFRHCGIRLFLAIIISGISVFISLLFGANWLLSSLLFGLPLCGLIYYFSFFAMGCSTCNNRDNLK
jgi:hypothetical protein